MKVMALVFILLTSSVSFAAPIATTLDAMVNNVSGVLERVMSKGQQATIGKQKVIKTIVGADAKEQAAFKKLLPEKYEYAFKTDSGGLVVVVKQPKHKLGYGYNTDLGFSIIHISEEAGHIKGLSNVSNFSEAIERYLVTSDEVGSELIIIQEKVVHSTKNGKDITYVQEEYVFGSRATALIDVGDVNTTLEALSRI